MPYFCYLTSPFLRFSQKINNTGLSLLQVVVNVCKLYSFSFCSFTVALVCTLTPVLLLVKVFLCLYFLPFFLSLLVFHFASTLKTMASLFVLHVNAAMCCSSLLVTFPYPARSFLMTANLFLGSFDGVRCLSTFPYSHPFLPHLPPSNQLCYQSHVFLYTQRHNSRFIFYLYSCLLCAPSFVTQGALDGILGKHNSVNNIFAFRQLPFSFLTLLRRLNIPPPPLLWAGLFLPLRTCGLFKCYILLLLLLLYVHLPSPTLTPTHGPLRLLYLSSSSSSFLFLFLLSRLSVSFLRLQLQLRLMLIHSHHLLLQPLLLPFLVLHPLLLSHSSPSSYPLPPPLPLFFPLLLHPSIFLSTHSHKLLSLLLLFFLLVLFRFLF